MILRVPQEYEQKVESLFRDPRRKRQKEDATMNRVCMVRRFRFGTIGECYDKRDQHVHFTFFFVGLKIERASYSLKTIVIPCTLKRVDLFLFSHHPIRSVRTWK
jgi:hypothetical protein